MRFLTSTLAALLLAGVSSAAMAQDPALESRYQRELAQCDGLQGEERNDCRRDATAAYQQALRAPQADHEASFRLNRISRCQRLPADQRADCLRLMEQQSTTQGSIQGGGVLRETIIQIPAPTPQPAPTPLPPAAPSPAQPVPVN